jgi:hypothetical protein
VDENVFSAFVLDKAVPFGGVEPLDGANDAI